MAKRYLSAHYDASGMLVVSAQLLPEEGALFLLMLKAHAPADVSAETPAEQRRADALMTMVDRLNSGDGFANDRVEVTVHVDAPVLSGEDGRAEVDGNAVSPEVVERLSCGGSAIEMRHGNHGEVLSVGRKTRRIGTALGRALKERDGGCTFPGCTNRIVDAHHLIPWSRGGETNLDNTTLVCRRHHRFVHELGFRAERRPDGEVAFFEASGAEIPTAGLPQPVEFNARPRDTSDMGAWAGVPFDYHRVISGLFAA